MGKHSAARAQLQRNKCPHGRAKGWAHPGQKKTYIRTSVPQVICLVTPIRRVRNVMDHRNAFTGGKQCCQSQRAAPVIL